MKYFCSKCGKTTEYNFELPKFCSCCGQSFASKKVATQDSKTERFLNELKLKKNVNLEYEDLYGEEKIYWIVVRRTGTLDPLNYYTVALDEDAGYGAGYLRMWTGAAWVSRTVDASMIFRVEGVEATTAQIAEIVDAAGQFLTGTALDDVSGIDTLQFRDGIVDALTELGDLLTLGTSNARRLLCAVERDRSLRVREEPAYTGTPDYVRHLDGRITTPQGVALSPGEVPVGVWLRVETPIPPGQGVNVDPTLLFVERCEYNAAGMEYNITPRGAVNIWRLAVAPSRG